MSTFVYAPGIKVYIQSYKLKQIVDVSEDLTGASMQRRSDGVSQFQFGLINPLRKYDGIFTPNDRIVVAMKRLRWMRTFTGYLNSVPLFSSWPRNVDLTASCSLKRLQYFHWDPNLAASQQLVRESLRIQTDGSAPDGGIKQVVINLLEEVVDWSGAQVTKDKTLAGTKVHIASIPSHWFQAAAQIYKGVAENVEQEVLLANQLLASLGGGPTVGGNAPIGRGVIPPGTGGLNETQRAWAEKMLTAAFADGASVRDAEYCVGCCLQESNFYMYANYKLPESQRIPHDKIGGYDIPGGSNSVGLFQQQAGSNFSWGTVAQCMDVTHSTKKFLSVLRTVKNRDSLPFTTAIQRVQRSGTPNAYAKHEAKAKEIVRAYMASSQALGNDPAFVGNSGGGGTGPVSPNQADRLAANALPKHGTTTAEQIVQVAQQAIAKNPNLRYVYGSPTSYDDPNPVTHDCSTFTRWVYYQSLGALNGMPRVSHDQYKWAIANGGREISIEDGERTPGALLFRGYNEGRIHHVEISLGTGGRSIGAHSASSSPQVGESRYRLGYYDKAVLLPAVVYPNTPGVVAATGDPNGASPTSGALGNAYIQASLDARLDLSQRIQQATGLESLFGSVPWEAAAGASEEQMGLSEGLVGIRALSNDTPILPYIGNLMNSTMRQFCSAPNGDFIGWFPDYYGIWGTAAKMVLQSIEVKDFTVTWSDEYFVTHQFVSQTNDGGQQIDLTSGGVSAVSVLDRFSSFGIATIDQPGIMAPLFGLDQTHDETLRFTKFVYERFGPRPNYTQIPGVTGGAGEFFMALFLFMQNWTMQYNANIEITFMPELFPGMLIQFPEYNFQAYVNTVNHNVSFGPGGGFSTTINIQAPARIKDTGDEDRFIGLPIAAFGGKPLKSSGQKSSTTKAKETTKKTPINPRLARLE